MRKVTTVLLFAAYLTLALSAAVYTWRAGGWPAGVATAFGAFAFFMGLHGLIRRGLDRTALESEISAVREAHVILADQIEQMQGQMAALSNEVHVEAEELSGEMKMLEHLVQSLSLGAQMRQYEPSPHLAQLATPRDQRSAILDAVREALADNRVDLYLQPIVSLPQRKTVFYESFSRLRDESGRVMMPAEYLAVAEPEGLMSAIDNLLLFRCVQIVRRLAKQDRRVGIFCNIALGSLADEVFFPQFLDFLSQNKDLHGAIIFELGQQAFRQRGSTEARNMAKLADLGFAFSIDKVTDLDLDFNDLARSDVEYVKVSAEVLQEQLLDVDGQPTLKIMRDLNAADFADLTRRYGVELIAEKVESEKQVIDVLELNIGYGQGHLFGQPRAIKEAVLAESAPPPAYTQTLLRRAAGAR
jgi:cyclic-di-GMP phosphodiesterase TipF (flagellum assembly factor)